MFNNDFICPAPGINATGYAFAQTEESFDLSTKLLAGAVVTLGVALWGAAKYQMTNIRRYIDRNGIWYPPLHQPNRYELLKIARKLARVDPNHPSLLNPRIHQGTLVLEDLIKTGKKQDILKFLELGPCSAIGHDPTRENLFSFVIHHNLERHIPFLIESGFKPSTRFLRTFFDLDKARQDQLIDKMIGPKVSPFRDAHRGRRRPTPTKTHLTKKQTKFISVLFGLTQIPELSVEKNKVAILKVIDRASDYHFNFGTQLSPILLYLFIENPARARTVLQIFIRNGWEIIPKTIQDLVLGKEAPQIF